MRRAVPSLLISLLTLLLAVAILAVVPTPAAQAHVERPSYYPNPKADCSISPCAGGAVPKARSLRSAPRRFRPRMTS